MKITLNELRSLVKQVIREAKEEKSKKKGFDVSKLKKGVKLTVDMGNGKEKVEVMDNFKAGVTDLKFVTLKRSKGAPYTITIGKLKDVIVEGYDKRPAIDENFIELEVNPNGKDFKLFSIIFKNGDFPQSNMGYRNYESIGKKAYFNFSIDEKDELIDMLNQMYDESGDEDIMNWIDDIESYKSEESEEEGY